MVKMYHSVLSHGAAIFLPVAMLVGCRADSASSAGPYPIIRDSAGIEIVLNASIADAPPVVVFDSAFAIDIGGIKENHLDELDGGASHNLIRLPDGRVVVPNGRELRFYDAGGHLLNTVGRSGEGPREISSTIWNVCLIAPDTLLILEYPAPRIGVVTSLATLEATVTHTGTALAEGCVPDGFLAKLDSSNPEMERLDAGQSAEAKASVYPTARYGVLAANGLLLREVGMLPDALYGTLFSRDAPVAATAGGIVAGSGETQEYRQYDPLGRLIRIVRTSDVLGSMSRDEVGAMIARRMGRDAPEARVRSERERALANSNATRLPAYMRINLDAHGRVWLSEPRLVPGQLEKWSVFDSTGILLGRADPNDIKVPMDSRLIARRWTATELIVQYTDADGAVHIAAMPYRLVPVSVGSQ